jgi:aconitate hydratase
LNTLIAGEPHKVADLVGFAGVGLERLPWVLRILLENVLRHESGERPAGEANGSRAHSILAWLETGTSSAEIPFYPARLLMHDTTCVPALVDIAGLRSELAEAGQDPGRLNPRLPIDVSVDHSIAVDRFGTPDALQYNMAQEIQRNGERYRLLKWATQALRGVRVHPPGTGIMHTLNLERLATVVTTGAGAGGSWVYPDTLIGTDSHTPMVNGIGVLAWGVGGVEAESVMFGMPVMLKVPEVIGVRMTGALREGILATDLALTVTERLRQLRLAGKFVEFFGPGVSSLSCGERAVIANMAPEYGASCGYFPVDQRTLEYLRVTGRPEPQIALVEAYCREQHLWFEPQAVPRYTEVIDMDLGKVATSIAGPHRPQDRLAPGETVAWLARALTAGGAAESSGRAPRNLATARVGLSNGAVSKGATPRVPNDETAKFERRSRYRRDHELYQHFGPTAGDCGGVTCQEGSAIWRRAAVLGENLARAGIADGRELPAAVGSAAGPGGVGIRDRRIWLHDLHWQLGWAGSRDGRGDPEARHSSCRGAFR